MHFILISKKEDFREDNINYNYLNSKTAPSLIARESIKMEINDFVLFLYPYDHIEKESSGYSYQYNEDEFFLINGIANIEKENIQGKISNFFSKISDESVQLIGDYQLVSINKKGNGFIRTPPLSIRQLFFYEDKSCAVLSTEIKLIVDGVNKFREKKFVNNFDEDFIEDASFREWKTRKFPRSTIFKDIKRVLPQDNKYFKKGRIVIEKKDSIVVPNWFKEDYYDNKELLYDQYYQILINFAENNLLQIKDKITKIDLGLTGGFDSRLTASIFANICKKHKIHFECNTYGDEEHPDVVIAKKISEVLDIQHNHIMPSNQKAKSTTEYENYSSTFYVSQGDFNSKNFMANYNRKINNPTVLSQMGMDAYKRLSSDQIISANRWYARINLCTRNYFFPLFFTKYETWFASLYHEKGEDTYKEFVYEILKRSNPDLLDIPFAGDFLPQIDVKSYSTIAESKFHEKEPFLWDYYYARNNLKPIFSKRMDKKLGKKSKLVLKIIGLNELDYFLNKNLENIINSYRKGKIDLKTTIKQLIKEKKSKKYPKKKTEINMTKEVVYDPYINKLQILMDFAAAANKKSFTEIEKEIGLY